MEDILSLLDMKPGKKKMDFFFYLGLGWYGHGLLFPVPILNANSV